jgi:hypothetical protein
MIIATPPSSATTVRSIRSLTINAKVIKKIMPAVNDDVM